VRPAEQRRIRTFVPTVNPLRGSAGPKLRTCLADLLGAGGSGLSKISPRALLVSVFSTMLGIMAFAAVPALASKPETPEISGVVEVRSTQVTVLGVLNPNALVPGEVGAYQYVYRPSTNNECKGAGEVRLPEPPEMSMGLQHEELEPKRPGGLQPGTEYAICLVATEPGKTEPADSAAVTFKTRLLPEQPLTEPASNLTSTAAQLNATLNPGATAESGETYVFYLNRESEGCQGEHNLELPPPHASATGIQDEIATIAATGLLPNTRYTYCAVVLNEIGESAVGQAISFETPPAAPTFAGLVAEEIRSSEVTLAATVSPGGLPTEVKISGVSKTPSKQLPAAKTPVSIRQRITGLLPATKYTAMLVGKNNAGEDEAEVEFQTAGVATENTSSESCANESFVGFQSRLPDCRAVELVSSATESGEVYDPGGSDGHEEDITTARPFRAAANGAGVAYVGDPGATGGDGSSAKGRGNEFIATRNETGWSARNVTPPVGAGENSSAEREYVNFSSDLSAGALVSELPLIGAAPSPQVPERCAAVYGVNETAGLPSYGALFANTLTSSYCGEIMGGSRVGSDGSILFGGETPDHSLRVFDSQAELVSPAVEAAGFGANVYVSSAPTADLAVANVLPTGEVEPHAVAGGPSQLPGNGPDLSNILAPDGSRVIWSSVVRKESRGGSAAFSGALYARESPFSPSAHTVQLDSAETGAEGSSGGGEYWTSAAGVDKTFFTDCNRLTTDSTAINEGNCAHVTPSRGELIKEGADLYEYNFDPARGGRALIDLTVDRDPNDPLGANVQGVLGVSDNGTYVYFVAGGSLGAGPNARGDAPLAETCETATPESPEFLEEEAGHVPLGRGCNLFVLHFNGTSWEAPQFIAKLAAQDDIVDQGGQDLNDPFLNRGAVVGDWNPDVGSRTAEVTPDGKTLVFSSIQDITGYNTGLIGSNSGGQGGNEIFRYSATTNSVICVSCDPQNSSPNLADGRKGDGFNTYVPVSTSGTFMHRWVNSTGTEVFFDSSQALNGADSNGRQDVYEWVAPGSASCPTSTSVYGGCVFLFTAGDTESFSFLVDVDETGENVFVTHRGPLYGVGPSDTKAHLFDLRTGGGGNRAVAIGCTTTATCPAAPAAGIEANPPASSLIGVKEVFPSSLKSVPKSKPKSLKTQKLAKALKACKKDKSNKSRFKCERQARQKYGTAKAKSNRRAR
jgi:hypothetical protein